LRHRLRHPTHWGTIKSHVAAPLVSVVTIFLDAEPFLRQAIESVRGQSFPDWELLLVDDGSTDGSGAIAREYAAAHPEQIRYLQHPGGGNRGMSASRNLGTAHATGRWIAMLDADDEWQLGHLDALLEATKRHPGVEMIYGPALTWFSWDPTAQTADFVQDIGYGAADVDDRGGLARFYIDNPGAVPCNGAQLILRDAYNRLGGFDPVFRGLYEDQAFAFKMALGATVRMLPRPTLLYRRHDASCCAISVQQQTDVAARIVFLRWARRYASAHAPGDRALAAELRHHFWQARRARGPLALLTRAAHRYAPKSALAWMRQRRARPNGTSTR
jgi:glycosyltransferase involved in cell wall biosynthesis